MLVRGGRFPSGELSRFAARLSRNGVEFPSVQSRLLDRPGAEVMRSMMRR
jgi:hypothetical protein